MNYLMNHCLNHCLNQYLNQSIPHKARTFGNGRLSKYLQLMIMGCLYLVIFPLFAESESHTNHQILNGLIKPVYVCPMHSHILSDKVGKCPICGMDLVLKETDDQELDDQELDNNKLDDGFPAVSIKPAILNHLSIKTAKIVRGNLNHRIETLGKITRIDPMARSRITSPIQGKIAYINEKYSGDLVKRDERLFSIESLALFDLEREYLLAVEQKNRSIASQLIVKLRKSGLDAEQIAMIQDTKRTNLPVHVNALEDGFVYAKRGEVGEKITPSFTVFNLGGNYQVIEVTAEIFERQWGLVKEGQKAQLRMRNLPGIEFEGVVERVDEPVGYTTRALEVRIKFKTERNDLSQSTFARVFIDARSKQNVLLAPRDSVIETAESTRIVKVLDNQHFQPVEVVIGEESNGHVEILSGINEGDTIVSSGQFLIDSESNILTALERLSSSNSATTQSTERSEH